MTFGRFESGRTRAPLESSATSEVLESAHKKAKRVLENRSYTIAPHEFDRTYSKEEVDSDTKLALERRAQYEHDRTAEQQEAYMLAEIFEAILLSEGQESGWFGDDVKILKTTDYDDVINHTDLIAEWHPRTSRARALGLAVDVTFGPSTLEKKFSLLQDKIDRGQLGKLKYVHDEQKHAPHVVIGMSRETVRELMRLWTEEEYDALKKHPIQRVVLEQICAQLAKLGAYARSKGKESVARAYAESLETIRPILAQKMHIDAGALHSDAVATGIAKQLEKRFSI